MAAVARPGFCENRDRPMSKAPRPPSISSPGRVLEVRPKDRASPGVAAKVGQLLKARLHLRREQSSQLPPRAAEQAGIRAADCRAG